MVSKLGRDGTHRNISPAYYSRHCSRSLGSLCSPRLDSVEKLIHESDCACGAVEPVGHNGPGLRAVALATALSLLSAHGMAAEEGPKGDWLVANKEARIRIVDCAGTLWGVLSWEAKPGLDSHNPDPAKRTRPMLGVPIVLGMKPSGPNKWSGSIYNSAWGKIFSGGVSLENPDTLRITGCLLFLCGGENWSRAADPAPGKVLDESDDAICKSVMTEQ